MGHDQVSMDFCCAAVPRLHDVQAVLDYERLERRFLQYKECPC